MATKTKKTKTTKQRLEYLRGELRAERLSYDEVHELQSLAPHIDSGDVELLEAAGVPEGKKLPPILKEAYVQEIGDRQTSLGIALYIKIRRQDDKPMSWTEVWQVFNDRYPNKWATSFFPPEEELVDEANVYHLFVLDFEPQGVNINRR